MKSGTNWLCKLLNLHPEISSSGEYHWESYFRTYLHNRKVFRNLDEIELESATIRKELQQLAERAMFKLSNSDAKFIGDRTPTTIHPVVFKDAAYLCMMRDIRDIVVSKVFHFLNSPRVLANYNMAVEVAGLKPQFDKDPWFFHKHPEKLLASERFVRTTCKTWRQTIKSNQNTAKNHKTIRVSFIKYEDLQNPNKFNRKGQVGDWKNYMTPPAKRWINDECGNLMMELGYIDSMNWKFTDVSKKRPNNQGQKRGNQPAPQKRRAA